MKLLVDDIEIMTSTKVEKLPKEFIDFALKNRSTNGNYFWKQHQYNGYPFRLESIDLLDRRWGPNFRALSLRFSFSYPIRHYLAGYNRLASAQEIEKIDAKCYKYGFVRYDEYYTNIDVGEDVCSAIIQLNLDNSFPSNLNYLIKRID